jgi:acetylornithine deacetylase/succinyl-diaminopimelate desuccinylase-like protein
VRAAHAILSKQTAPHECEPVAEMIHQLGGASARGEIVAHRATQPLLRDTISLTMMRGGYKINVIPEEAEMSFDCRLLPDTNEQRFVSDLRRAINDESISIDVRWPSVPTYITQWRDDSPMFQAIKSACSARVPRSLVTPSISVVTTDARLFRSYGIPAYGLVPCLLTESDLKGYHGVDERISLNNLLLGIKIIFDITIALCSADFATQNTYRF